MERIKIIILAAIDFFTPFKFNSRPKISICNSIYKSCSRPLITTSTKNVMKVLDKGFWNGGASRMGDEAILRTLISALRLVITWNYRGIKRHGC